ncbi:MAG: SGNH/GDSL hydrolase family protein [Balneolales bacterium]|nr:SGNH/GDSL hydrolase family protein [Balneolales bacterium]
MIAILIQYTVYGLIFYGGYRFLRHQVYARGGALPIMHPGAFLKRYYRTSADSHASTPFQRLQQWIKESEAAELTDTAARVDATLEKTEDYPAKVLVCLGDSITHGRCSDDYVQRVRDEIRESGWEVVNAGINGDTAWNMLQRLQDVIACKPDAVTILAGTNDVNAAQSTNMEASYRRSKHIPVSVNLSLDGFIHTMREIILSLRSAGIKHIAVYTIPMIGETDTDAINQTVEAYNLALLTLCTELGVTVLELHEAQRRIIRGIHYGELPSDEHQLAQIIAERPARFEKLKGYDVTRVEREINIAPYRRFVMMQSWNTIADHYGYYTLIDGMHLNDRGGIAAAMLLLRWVQRNLS